MEAKIIQQHKDSAKALKKIAGSGGKLNGNFFYVGNATLTTLVLTLLSRDPKGIKARKAGKEFRKQVAFMKAETLSPASCVV